MSKLHLAAAAAAAVFALHSADAHAGWVGWNWPTSHFTGTFTRDPAHRNFIRVQKTQPAAPTLLLFLPGTGSDNVGDYTDFLNAAASHGYYVVGLDYRHNQHHPDMVGCWSAADAQYFDEQVNGSEQGWWSADDANDLYPETNSVSYRLHELLLKLQAEQPGGVTFDWMQFWNASTGAPAWSKIVVAGHSQGGSTAAYIAKTKSVKGALVFEGMYDDLNRGQPSAGAPNHITDFVPARWPGTPTSGPDDCNGQRADVAAGWIAPGAWAQRVVIVDAQLSTAYNGQWGGHHIEVTAPAAGKTTQIWMNSAAPASIAYGWYTIQNAAGPFLIAADAPTCTTSSGAPYYHASPIANGCYPAWIPDLWDELLERAKTLDTNPVLP